LEYRALVANDIWELVPTSSNHNIIGCKWVYKIKYCSDSSVEKYKARLGAQGFRQQASIFYHETFIPVSKLVTIRLLLSFAVSFHWPIR